MSLLQNNNAHAIIEIEVWDWQTNTDDRLIGSAELPVSQLLYAINPTRGPKGPMQADYSNLIELTPPSFSSRSGAMNRSASIMGGGVSSKPGTISVLQARRLTPHSPMADTTLTYG